MHGGTVGDGRGGPGSSRVRLAAVRSTARVARVCCARGGGHGRVGCTGSTGCGSRGGPCGQCLVTHVLLPVTVLLRRAYAAEVIGAALLARAAGKGHRSIGAALKVPAATVRGWLRVMAGRLDLARVHLLQVAHRAGVDITVPEACGCPWRDLLAALGAATAALTGRFGPVGVLGPVTAWQVAAACSAGRLLAPGWPAAGRRELATRVAPDVRDG